ncbi:MAG: hypothetical protein R3D78_10370 [Paracoccaceae bacterium]
MQIGQRAFGAGQRGLGLGQRDLGIGAFHPHHAAPASTLAPRVTASSAMRALATGAISA